MPDRPLFAVVRHENAPEEKGKGIFSVPFWGNAPPWGSNLFGAWDSTRDALDGSRERAGALFGERANSGQHRYSVAPSLGDAFFAGCGK